MPVQVAAWLGCLAFFVALCNGIIKLSDRARGKSSLVDIRQPLEVTEATKFVRKEECISRHKESATRVSVLEQQVAELRQERHEDATLLHEKVNRVGERVAGLESESKQQNNWLQRIDQKLDALGVQKRVGL